MEPFEPLIGIRAVVELLQFVEFKYKTAVREVVQVLGVLSLETIAPIFPEVEATTV